MNEGALRSQQLLVSSMIKPASQLRGLTFGNRIDRLLQGGLLPKTLTFLYGAGANSMMNLLCANAVRIYGGKAMFVDAANSFDPYLIVRKNKRYARSEKASRDFIESIIVSRAFTCYQLRKLVTSKILDLISNKSREEEENDRINSVFISGVSSLFSKEDNTPFEVTRIELLMARALREIASDKDNGVLFVVASSGENSPSFTDKSDTAIKLFRDCDGENRGGKRKKRRQVAETKAVLMKHYSRKFETVSL